MLRKTTVLAAFGLALALMGVSAHAEDEKPLREVSWSFQGPFGKFDQAQLQRGYKVYHDVCSTCHSMNLVTFGDMARIGGPFYDPKYPNSNDNPYVKSLAKDYMVNDIDDSTGDTIQRPATTSDHFKAPFPNAAAAGAANGGKAPPDMSLLAKAREGGPAYIYSLVTSYENPPAGVALPPGKYYNPYFPGNHVIGMPPPLRDGAVSFDDGTAATKDQEAKDVSAFLAWASEPHQQERKQMGLSVLIYLLIFAGLLYASYKRIWRNVGH